MKNTINMKNVKYINNLKKFHDNLLYLEFKGSVGHFYIFKCIKRYNKQSDRIEKCNFYVVYSLKRKDILFKFYMKKLSYIYDLLTDSVNIKFLEEVVIFGGKMIQNFVVVKENTKSYYLYIANKQDMYNQDFVLSKFNAQVNLINPDCLCSGSYVYN